MSEDLSKNNELKNAYATDVATFGQTVADAIYTIHYNDQDMLLLNHKKRTGSLTDSRKIIRGEAG